MFGLRQIVAKIINNKLVIRVGGGYMNVDEFIDQYGRIEMTKMLKAEKNKNKNKGLLMAEKEVELGYVKEMINQTFNQVADEAKK